jgi:hypothetical protein
VATYSGTIDLRVTGNALKEVDLVAKRINEIRSLAKSLKPAPNLFDKRGNERIVKAKEELRKLVNEYGKGTGAGKRFSNTLAGLNSQISAFGRIIGNVNVNSDEFVSAITAQEKASRRLAKAEAERLKVQTRVNTANTVGRATSVQETLDLGKVIPKSIAGLELYQRELQETFRNVEIGTESYRELRDEILRVNALMRDPVMSAAAPSSPIGGRADIPGSPAALAADRNARAQRRSQRRRDVLTGAGFPLLFGGGPVQALAGGIGGAFGGLGGSIAGSAIASQVEAFARAAAQAGVAVTSTGGALDFVREKSLFSKEANRELAAQLEEQGNAAELAKLLAEELSLAIGNEGVKSLQALGDETKETTRLWGLLTTQLFSLISGPLTKFLEIVNNVLGGVTTEQQFRARREDLGAEGAAALDARVEELMTGDTSRLNPTQLRSGKGRGIGALSRQAAMTQALGEDAFQVAATPIPVTDEDRRRFAPKARKDKLPDLQIEIGLQERLLALDKQIAQATLDENDKIKSILEKEKIRETLEANINKIKNDGLQPAVEAAKIDLERLDAAQKIQDIDINTDQINANKTKKAKETLDGLLAEQALLQATLDGKEDEVRLEQRIKDILGQNTKLTDDEVREILEGNAALREKIRLQEQSKALYERITKTIEDGLVDGIMSAVEGTKSLSESLSGVLRQLARMFLSQGIGSFGKDGNKGTGLLGVLGFADGGRPPVGRPSIVGERGPELFVPRSSGTIIPNHALGGSATVNVAVDASGSSVEGNADQAAQLGKVIGVAVQQELIKQKRPGGLLAS